jgi:protein-tyrosine kinase
MNDRGTGLIQRAAERLRKQQPDMGLVPAPVAPPSPAGAPAAAAAREALAPQLPLPPLPPAPIPSRTAFNDGPHVSTDIKIDRQRLAKSGITFSVTERSRIAEEFRIVTRQILAKAEAGAESASGARIIMVTSARPREGKTFTAINLALAISSQPDFRVLAVDCDVERQSMTSMFGIEAPKGFVDLLVDDRTDMRDVLIHTDVANLTILPAGPKRAGIPELLSSRRMRDILTEMADRYSDRYIVLDAPPCLATSDPSILASLVGQIVFVVEANRTQESEIEESIRLISTCPNISLILNKVEGTASDHFGSYGYY